MIRWFFHFLPISGLPKTHIVVCYGFEMHPPMPDETVITGELTWVPTKGSVGFELTPATPCVTLAIPHDAAGGTLHETTVPSSSGDESFLVPL
jgi:hypothetical protein